MEVFHRIASCFVSQSTTRTGAQSTGWRTHAAELREQGVESVRVLRADC